MSPQMRTTRSGKVRPVRYRSVQAPMVAWLTLVWWVLWGSYSLLSLAGGIVVGVLVCLVFPLPPLRMSPRFHPWRLLVLVATFHWHVFVASWQVAKVTILLPRPISNALIEVPLRSRSDLVLTMVAQLTSLIPGTVVVEAHRTSHTLFLHAIDVRDLAGVESVRRGVLAQEMRVLRAFGTAEEIASAVAADAADRRAEGDDR